MCVCISYHVACVALRDKIRQACTARYDSRTPWKELLIADTRIRIYRYVSPALSHLFAKVDVTVITVITRLRINLALARERMKLRNRKSPDYRNLSGGPKRWKV